MRASLEIARGEKLEAAGAVSIRHLQTGIDDGGAIYSRLLQGFFSLRECDSCLQGGPADNRSLDKKKEREGELTVRRCSSKHCATTLAILMACSWANKVSEVMTGFEL